MAKHVVVIGGGMSAKHAAQEIAKASACNVTMIQASKFVEWPIAMTTVLANPELHYKALSADPALFEISGVKYKYGVVTDVDTSKRMVTLKDGQAEPYDALVVATGFHMPLIYPELGATLDERKAEVKKVGAAIKEAGCVVICGAGAVGIELAGDIRVANPDKRIVVLARDQLLKQYPENVRSQVAAGLKEKNIEVVIGDLKDAPTELKLEQGVVSVSEAVISYDVFIPAYSRGANTGFLNGAQDMLDARGYIRVNGFLQSEASPEVFTVGVGNVDEPFVAVPKLEGQWKSVARNVKALLEGKPLTKHSEGMPGMKRLPIILAGRGKGGFAAIDFASLPAPVKCCCCFGLGGFPCCPPPCCWPCCGPFACGYCFGPPTGEGPARLLGGMEFKSGGFHFKGLGKEAPPAQQKMGAD